MGANRSGFKRTSCSYRSGGCRTPRTSGSRKWVWSWTIAAGSRLMSTSRPTSLPSGPWGTSWRGPCSPTRVRRRGLRPWKIWLTPPRDTSTTMPSRPSSIPTPRSPGSARPSSSSRRRALSTRLASSPSRPTPGPVPWMTSTLRNSARSSPTRRPTSSWAPTLSTGLLVSSLPSSASLWSTRLLPKTLVVRAIPTRVFRKH
mmetsp:Transcript_12426/g.35067  ORF Transcript_12426/g.35067 Transcript_12426/m.35067 type:complete len:201 (+) Transcript_12426:179-781(+)